MTLSATQKRVLRAALRDPRLTIDWGFGKRGSTRHAWKRTVYNAREHRAVERLQASGLLVITRRSTSRDPDGWNTTAWVELTEAGRAVAESLK